MKKFNINKKLILFLLIILLGITIFFSYMKISGVNTKEFIYEEEKNFENNSNELKDNSVLKLNHKNREKNSKKSKNEEKEIINIASIDEIKNPFKEKKIKKTDNKLEKNKKENINYNRANNSQILYLEKNLIEKDFLNNNSLNLKDKKSNKNDKLKREKTETKAQQKVIKKNTVKNNILNTKLPFKLLGIIKNKNNSTALVYYQGKRMLIKENEFLNKLLIEEINNQSIIISYNEEKRKIKLWEEKK